MTTAHHQCSEHQGRSLVLAAAGSTSKKSATKVGSTGAWAAGACGRHKTCLPVRRAQSVWTGSRQCRCHHPASFFSGCESLQAPMGLAQSVYSAGLQVHPLVGSADHRQSGGTLALNRGSLKGNARTSIKESRCNGHDYFITDSRSLPPRACIAPSDTTLSYSTLSFAQAAPLVLTPQHLSCTSGHCACLLACSGRILIRSSSKFQASRVVRGLDTANATCTVSLTYQKRRHGAQPIPAARSQP